MENEKKLSTRMDSKRSESLNVGGECRQKDRLLSLNGTEKSHRELVICTGQTYSCAIKWLIAFRSELSPKHRGLSVYEHFLLFQLKKTLSLLKKK